MITSHDERWSGSYYQVVQDIYSTYVKERNTVPASTPSDDDWTIISDLDSTALHSNSISTQKLNVSPNKEQLDSPSSSLYTFSSSCAGSTFIHSGYHDFFPSTNHGTPLSKDMGSLRFTPRIEDSSDFSHLIDAAIETIESIWRDAAFSLNITLLPSTLRDYVIELLSRSHTTIPTLQISLLYLSRLHSRLTTLHFFDSNTSKLDHGFRDARLTFMTAVMLAAKYLIDNAPSNAAWSSLSGVDVRRVNEMEAAFLGIVRYKLYVSDETWKQLSELATVGEAVGEKRLGKTRFRWSGASVERWRTEVETRPMADGG
ncbi:hypothetical protein BJ742DRAFT_786172 [Cladochytrium replicatum]|nr:hypothetical protein BJ742DRAFT_786172 [Cladochytrium replicatum]